MKAEVKPRRCDACGHDHDSAYTVQSPDGLSEVVLCGIHVAAGLRYMVSRYMQEAEFEALTAFVKRVKVVGL